MALPGATARSTRPAESRSVAARDRPAQATGRGRRGCASRTRAIPRAASRRSVRDHRCRRTRCRRRRSPPPCRSRAVAPEPRAPSPRESPGRSTAPRCTRGAPGSGRSDLRPPRRHTRRACRTPTGRTSCPRATPSPASPEGTPRADRSRPRGPREGSRASPLRPRSPRPSPSRTRGRANDPCAGHYRPVPRHRNVPRTVRRPPPGPILRGCAPTSSSAPS